MLKLGRYQPQKIQSSHLKVKSIKMFTERLCHKGIGNVLNFRIEVSLGEQPMHKVKLNSFKLKVLLY